MNLQSKFFVTISFLMASVILFMGFVVFATHKAFLQKEMNKRQKDVLESLSTVAREALVTKDLLLLVNYLKVMKKSNPEIGLLCVLDLKGRILASSIPGATGELRGAVSVPEGLILRRAPVVSIEPPAEVEIGFDKAYLDAQIHESLAYLTRIAVWVGLGALGIGFVGAFILSRNLSRPILEMSRLTQEIGKGRLDVSIPSDRGDELGYLAGQFNSMTKRLRELDEMKQDFVHAVTHELRSPLSAIESHANAMIEELERLKGIPAGVVKDWRSSIHHVKVNTSRLNRFVSALLDLAKIERGKMDINPQAACLRELAEEVFSLMGPKAKEKGIRLINEVQGTDSAAHADPQRIHQVLVNLVANAVKFTPARGEVRISAKPHREGWICVGVKDTGPGISPEFMPRLFNKFEQAKELKDQVRDFKGTGLGLSICKGIVEGHGGEIWAESRPGEGAAFYFTLPSLTGPALNQLQGEQDNGA